MLFTPCADYFSFVQAIFQFSEDIPTVINHRAGYYFRGFVGEIPLSGSEDYRNIFSGEISRTINSFLPPPQWTDFYTLPGYEVVLWSKRRGRSGSVKKQKLLLGFFLIGGYIRQSENIKTSSSLLPTTTTLTSSSSVSVLQPGSLAQPLLVVHLCSMISRERDDLGE